MRRLYTTVNPNRYAELIEQIENELGLIWEGGRYRDKPGEIYTPINLDMTKN